MKIMTFIFTSKLPTIKDIEKRYNEICKKKNKVFFFLTYYLNENF